jgi:acyl-CoA synthetase (AMP-forming)/AMP-acid ligase II
MLRPASISVVLALPRSPAGKLLRSQLGQSGPEQREAAVTGAMS